MNVTINLDPTAETANVVIHDTQMGTFVAANTLKLGSTAHMTVAQAEAHARSVAKQALHAAAAAL